MWWNRTSHFEFDGKLMEIETMKLSEFPNGGKAILEKILLSGERSKYKRARLWESGIQVGKLVLTKTGYPVLMMDVKVSKVKHIRRWIDWENTIYVRWNGIKNHA